MEERLCEESVGCAGVSIERIEVSQCVTGARGSSFSWQAVGFSSVELCFGRPSRWFLPKLGRDVYSGLHFFPSCVFLHALHFAKPTISSTRTLLPSVHDKCHYIDTSLNPHSSKIRPAAIYLPIPINYLHEKLHSAMPSLLHYGQLGPGLGKRSNGVDPRQTGRHEY